ncbi:hypothetical protein GGS20DRAFT_255356 [Poronia punctata]|nr:hypothetical protein GGS20DRAFT_255356 [Poronia punctata]
MATKANVSTSTTTVDATTPFDETNPPEDGPPPGFTLRRAATIGQPSQIRRRPTSNWNHPPPVDTNTFTNLRRRSSTLSDIEMSADELLNPSKSNSEEIKKSPFVHVPIVAALLPAIAGIFFDNGAAFFTDLILLSIAAIFLHWSVTQPWDWYHSAQQIRVVQEEVMGGSVFESDSEVELATASPISSTLDNVPEERGQEVETEAATGRGGGREREADTTAKDHLIKENARLQRRREAAIKELYLHEVMALAWCFIFPMLGAYLLHAIRSQLSRPSEGLVSDYNLTIFLCAAEVRPISHLIRMVQQRTLHIQKVVAQNPYERQSVTSEQMQALYDRIEELEARSGPTGTSVAKEDKGASPEVPQKLVESVVGREMRKTVQPELEALSRAMRRYEKKLTLLANQADSRIESIDYRLNDAIALAAVAAKNSNSQWALTGWLVEKMANVIVLPLQAVVAMLTFPFRAVSALFRSKENIAPVKGQRPLRNSKSPVQTKGSSDRLTPRISRR